MKEKRDFMFHRLEGMSEFLQSVSEQLRFATKREDSLAS